MKRIKIGFAALCTLLFTSLSAMAEDVRIAVAGHGYFVGPLYVAMRDGLFEKAGLNADVIYTKGGALAFQAAFTRQAEFCITSFEHILTAAAQGRNITAIYGITHRPLNNVVASNAVLEENKGKSLSERIQSLKGKRVGTPSAGGSGEKMLTVLARQHGLTLPGDMELVYLGGAPAGYVAAFENDVIDAGMPFEPAGVLLEQKNLGGTLVNLMDGEVEAFTDLIFMTLCTHPDMLTEQPDLVKKMVGVFAEAQDILLEPERGIPIMGAEFSSLSPESNQQAYTKVSPIWNPSGRMSVEGAKKVFDYLQPKGETEIDFAATFSNDFLPAE